MATHNNGAAKRLILSLAAGAALSGCVYDPYYPYYGAYSTAPASTTYSYYPYSYYPYGYYPYSYYPYGYYYPYRYVGPPISLSFGYYHHSGHGWGGGHGWHGGGHGWHGGGGHGGGGHGWGGHGGGHGHR
jgi:hypothetical protein